MTVERRSVAFGSGRIEFTVSRRERSTLEIAVEPDASVVVAAPLDATPEDIAAKVRKRAAWVQRQQRFFEQYLPRTPAAIRRRRNAPLSRAAVSPESRTQGGAGGTVDSRVPCGL